MFHRTARLGILATLLGLCALCFAGVSCQRSETELDATRAGSVGVACVEAGKCFTSYGACETCEDSP